MRGATYRTCVHTRADGARQVSLRCMHVPMCSGGGGVSLKCQIQANSRANEKGRAANGRVRAAPAVPVCFPCGWAQNDRNSTAFHVDRGFMGVRCMQASRSPTLWGPACNTKWSHRVRRALKAFLLRFSIFLNHVTRAHVNCNSGGERVCLHHHVSLT